MGYPAGPSRGTHAPKAVKAPPRTPHFAPVRLLKVMFYKLYFGGHDVMALFYFGSMDCYWDRKDGSCAEREAVAGGSARRV